MLRVNTSSISLQCECGQFSVMYLRASVLVQRGSRLCVYLNKNRDEILHEYFTNYFNRISSEISSVFRLQLAYVHSWYIS